jgi:hypothetical protein
VAAPPEESPEPALSQQQLPEQPPSKQESPEQPLSKWLQLMLGEMARKRDALEQAHAEELRREAEAGSTSHPQSDRGAGS